LGRCGAGLWRWVVALGCVVSHRSTPYRYSRSAMGSLIKKRRKRMRKKKHKKMLRRTRHQRRK
jgi:hypothetical protein